MCLEWGEVKSNAVEDVKKSVAWKYVFIIIAVCFLLLREQLKFASMRKEKT